MSGLHGLLCSDLQRKRGDSVVSLKQIPQGPYNTNGADNNCNKEPPLPQTITRTIDDHGHYVPVPGQDLPNNHFIRTGFSDNTNLLLLCDCLAIIILFAAKRTKRKNNLTTTYIQTSKQSYYFIVLF